MPSHSHYSNFDHQQQQQQQQKQQQEGGQQQHSTQYPDAGTWQMWLPWQQQQQQQQQQLQLTQLQSHPLPPHQQFPSQAFVDDSHFTGQTSHLAVNLSDDHNGFLRHEHHAQWEHDQSSNFPAHQNVNLGISSHYQEGYPSTVALNNVSYLENNESYEADARQFPRLSFTTSTSVPPGAYAIGLDYDSSPDSILRDITPDSHTLYQTTEFQPNFRPDDVDDTYHLPTATRENQTDDKIRSPWVSPTLHPNEAIISAFHLSDTPVTPAPVPDEVSSVHSSFNESAQSSRNQPKGHHTISSASTVSEDSFNNYSIPLSSSTTKFSIRPKNQLEHTRTNETLTNANSTAKGQQSTPRFEHVETSTTTSAIVKREPHSSLSPVVDRYNQHRQKSNLIFIDSTKEAQRPKGKKRGYDLISSPGSEVTVLRDGNDQIQGETRTLGVPHRKVKTPSTPKAKADALRCRHIGSCRDCMTGKKRCDLHTKSAYESCTRCASLTIRYNGRPWPLCVRAQLIGLILHRDKPKAESIFHFKREDVYELDNMSDVAMTSPSNVKTLRISQVPGSYLEVYVAPFQPQDGDKVDCELYDTQGVKWIKKMPAYGLARIDDVRQNFQNYFDKNRRRYMEEIRSASELTRLMFVAACKFAKRYPKSMTHTAFGIWAACRAIEKPWTICGAETLGVSVETDAASPWYRIVPVTPMMNVQLDQIVIRDVLNRCLGPLLARLSTTIDRNTKENWYDSMMTSFLILNHCELAFAHSNEFAKQSGSKDRFSNRKLAESWAHAAKTVLSRVHHIARGWQPFYLDWTNPEDVNAAKLEKDQVEFLQRLRPMIQDSQTQMQLVRKRNQYEADTYWTGQIFFEGWQPGLPHLVEEISEPSA